jgi:peptidyl-prolyl cis-trans isomerase C
MIRIQSFALGVGALLLVSGMGGCAGSSKSKPPAGTQGSTARVWQPSPPSPGNPPVAVVNGRYITRHDVDSVLSTAPAGVREDYLKDPEQYKGLVERIVNQEAMYQAAMKAGTDRSKGYLSDLEGQQRQLLLRHYYQDALSALPAIADSTVRRYYNEHPAEFNIPGRARVRHIQVATQARAKEVLRKLRTSTWDEVAARYSTDKLTAKNGGILGFVTNDTAIVPGIGNAPAVVAASFTLKEGETSEPLKTSKGWHVIRADERTETGPQKYEAVQRQIRSNLENQRTEHFQTDLVASLQKEYGVRILSDSLQSAMAPALKPADLFARAQATESPTERIGIFQQLVREYPNDKSATQASFMIGFTYAEELKNYSEARKAFESFIAKYPQSDLVASAKWMIENMEHGVPPPSVGMPDTLIMKSGGLGAPPGGTNSRP